MDMNGGGLLKIEMCASYDIIHQYTTPIHSQYNGMVEIVIKILKHRLTIFASMAKHVYMIGTCCCLKCCLDIIMGCMKAPNILLSFNPHKEKTMVEGW